MQKQPQSILIKSTVLLLSFWISTPLLAWGSTFGSEGMDGSSGADGYAGNDGDDVVIRAQGQMETYYAGGDSGEDGQAGEPGGDAYGCRQPRRTDYDVEGADGGRGGNGGDGGAGGDAGDIIAYFNNISDLRKITVYSSPGTGGFPGDGGNGGMGCSCRRYQWGIRECRTVTEVNPRTNQPVEREVCERKQYYCTDGDNGRDGYSGSYGRNGQMGQVTLIPRMEPLGYTNPNLNIDMQRIDSQSFTLSQHLFENRTGTKSLFGPGSTLNNQYRIWLERIDPVITFNWNDPTRSPADFAGHNVALSIQGRQAVASFPSSVWAKTNISQMGNTTVVNVERALKQSEAMSFNFSKLQGRGASLEAVIDDTAGLSNLVDTKIKIKYYAWMKRRWFTRTKFYLKLEQEIPAANIIKSDDQLIVNLGNLGIKDTYTKQGRKIRVKLFITRSFGGRSEMAQQNLDHTIE